MKQLVRIIGVILFFVTTIEAHTLENKNLALFNESNLFASTVQEYIVQTMINDKGFTQEELVEAKESKEDEHVTLSFAGDTTLGIYYGQGLWNRFDEVYASEDDTYFFENVYPIFSQDDLTIVNLEGPLTDVGVRQQKQFAIKGEPYYGNILAEGAIDVVGLANNHTYDYGYEGYVRTKEVLENYDIGYFGEDVTYYTQIKEIDIAIIGAKGWDSSTYTKDKLAKRIELAHQNADLVVVMFHWGIEGVHYPNQIQKDLAYYVIDQGVDLVVGTHPHVIQGIETYKGKNIVYSLGNFSFGANKNPSDKDTFIYQESFKLVDGEIQSVETHVIPTRISSVTNRNDYKPTPLEGEAGDKIIERLKVYSQNFENSYFSN